ncbi:MAG: CPBP family intramembrane glutamic endopeptidase [Mycobacteriales bacterium]
MDEPLPVTAPPVTAPPDRPAGRPRTEIVLVLALSLGASALYALTSLVGSLTAPKPLAQQHANLNTSQAPGRPWLDLTYQLLGIGTALVPAVLAVFLLARAGRPATAIGVDLRRPRGDLLRGAALAMLIGVPGLGIYLAAHALGIGLSVVPESLPAVWWRYPVLVLAAVQNAVLEEVVVVGYLLTRLDDLGWRRSRALGASALLRGTYHLYQGFGGFVGNALMGVIFGWIFQRTKRIGPLVVAHALIDTVTFVGYALLVGHVSWLT